jgi:sirohydrochlorin ferrochelatase
MSASADLATAERWTKILEETEAKRLGVPASDARKSIARKLKASPGTLENIRRLRTKIVPSWLMSRIRGELIASLQMEVQRLEHEINIARQTGMDARENDLCAAEAQLAKAKEILSASR